MTSPCDNIEDIREFSAEFDVYVGNKIVPLDAEDATLTRETPGLAGCLQIGS